jgi:hypothetical protein
MYIGIEIIVFLCIGTMIGLFIGNNAKTTIPVTIIIFLNVSKIIIFIISISTYSNCIYQLSTEKMYLLIFFCINIVTIGMSENIVACCLLRNETTDKVTRNDTHSDNENYTRVNSPRERRAATSTPTQGDSVSDPLVPNANVSLITMPA